MACSPGRFAVAYPKGAFRRPIPRALPGGLSPWRSLVAYPTVYLPLGFGPDATNPRPDTIQLFDT
jgi:hypothetical protein